MDIMIILEMIIIIIVVFLTATAFFALAGVGFGFFWLVIWITCSKTLRQVIGIEFWILMISLIILSDQINTALYIPLLDETIHDAPYWIHIVAVASTFGLIVTIISILSLIVIRIKYGKYRTIFDIKMET